MVHLAILLYALIFIYINVFTAKGIIFVFVKNKY